MILDENFPTQTSHFLYTKKNRLHTVDKIWSSVYITNWVSLVRKSSRNFCYIKLKIFYILNKFWNIPQAIKQNFFFDRIFSIWNSIQFLIVYITHHAYTTHLMQNFLELFFSVSIKVFNSSSWITLYYMNKTDLQKCTHEK